MMKILLLCLLFLGCNTLAMSAEILAWKTPLRSFKSMELDAPAMVRLDKAPEASPFFNQDDELWDAKANLIREGADLAALEWAVWNATTRRLVAKGSWHALLELYHRFSTISPPIHSRIKMDLYHVAADGLPPDLSKKPDASMSCLVRSGQDVKISSNDQTGSFQLESNATVSENLTLINLHIKGDVSLADSPALSFDMGVALRDQFPLWIAREFDGKAGLDIVVTPYIQIADGSLLTDMVLKQEGNTAVPFPVPEYSDEPKRISLEDKQVLIWASAELGAFIGLYLDMNPSEDADPSKEVDPFSIEAHRISMKPRPFDFSKFKEVKAPENLAPHFTGMVFDISQLLMRNGINIHEGDFAGYDLKTNRIFMCSSDGGEIDKFDVLFMMIQCGSPSNIATTLNGQGQFRLLSLSGKKANLVSLNQKTPSRREFEIEPILGENGDLMDVRFKYDARTGEKTTRSMEGAITLENGKPLKVFEKEHGDETKSSLELKGEVLRLND